MHEVGNPRAARLHVAAPLDELLIRKELAYPGEAEQTYTGTERDIGNFLALLEIARWVCEDPGLESLQTAVAMCSLDPLEIEWPSYD